MVSQMNQETIIHIGRYMDTTPKDSEVLLKCAAGA